MHTLGERTLQIIFGASEPIEIFLRQIDPSYFEVSFHVANNVCQLKCEAQPFGEIGIARIAETENVQAGESHGSRYAIAILGKLVERRISRDGQIHLRAQNQIVEVAGRYFESHNRIGQRG